MKSSLGPRYFDDVYAASHDPWDFETSAYERDKYAHTLNSLPRDHYRNGFEIGCSIGVLTERLAPRCDRLLSVDVSQTALDRAQARCASLSQVTFRRMNVPDEFGTGPFDLILVSEVAYYFARPELELLADKIADHQDTGADLVLVHFTPFVPDYPATGDQVHEYFLTRREWNPVNGSREERYRIDVLRKAENGSASRSVR